MSLVNYIRTLTRAIYLLIFLAALNICLNLFYYLNPNTGNNQDPAEVTAWHPKSITTDIPEGEAGKQILYGYEIIKHTSTIIGPLALVDTLRFAGNSLNCNNCHLNAGRKIGAGSFIGVSNRYPSYSGRDNKESTLEDRINGCMQRSMNGKVMPKNNAEMDALIAYMNWLSEDVPEDIQQLYKGYLTLTLPETRADTKKGRSLYEEKCISCHMKGGRGFKDPNNEFAEYIYPPIGGNDSYNDGAGMHRIITAASFIKGNMPFGTTYNSIQLTDEEAYHIAAYINSFPRPTMPNRAEDFPKPELKPVSTPYGPWADTFSQDQHKFGPFQPIMAYYRDEYGIEKKK